MTSTKTAKKAAKKTAKKTSRKATKAMDEQSAIVLATLERAKKTVLARMGDKAIKPSPGTYTVSVSVDVNGDVVVAEPVAVKAGTPRPSYTDREVIVSLAIALMAKDANVRVLISNAVKRIGQWRLGSGTQKQLDAAEAVEIALREATERHGLFTEPTGATTRAGSITGKPSVSINGIVNQSAVNVAINMEGAA